MGAMGSCQYLLRILFSYYFILSITPFVIFIIGKRHENIIWHAQFVPLKTSNKRIHWILSKLAIFICPKLTLDELSFRGLYQDVS